MSRADPDEAATDSIARNTGFALGVKLTGAAFTAVLTIFLVRFLGPTEYGVFALAMSIGGLLLVPSDLGISQSAARFIAEVRGDRDAAAELVSDAIRLKLLVSGAFSAVLLVVAGPIAHAYDTPELTWPLRLVAIAIFGQSLVLLYGLVFEAITRVSASVRVIASESAIETGLSIGIVLLGTGAAGAMAGRASAYAFAAGYGLILVGRTLHRRVTPRVRGLGHARRIAGYGTALVVVDGAFTLFAHLDTLLIGAILNVAAVGLFQAPVRLTTFMTYLGLAARSGVAPRMRDREKGRAAKLERALRYLIVLQGVVVAPMLVWAEPITTILLGREYDESAEVLRALTPYAFLLGISPLLAGSVNYLGAARRRIPIAIATLALNLVIGVTLIPRIGIVAAGIGTDVAYIFYVAAHLRICRELVGLRLGSLLATLAWTAMAAGGMAGVLLLFGTGHDVGVSSVVVGGTLAMLVYTALLVAAGQITRAELGAVVGRARRIWPSG